MPQRRQPKFLPQFLSKKLIESRWPGIQIDVSNKTVDCPEGKILDYANGTYKLYFWYFLQEERRYGQRDKYKSISFPESLDIRKYLYFRRSGSYSLTRESQFKSIINPKGTDVVDIKITEGTQLNFRGNNLLIGQRTFRKALRDANEVYDKGKSYQKSAERYFSNLKSQKYINTGINKTTYIEKDEFKFLVSRLNLETKRKRDDFLKYLSTDDLTSIENLTTALLKNNVCSEDFLRRLNDYFIKEKLKEIIEIGHKILQLKSPNVTTADAQSAISTLNCGEIRALEALWQKYFEKYLLYLIFTYKKVFPKVELQNIEGEKKYPDFIGVNHYNGLDVIEIKTHLKHILSWDPSHNNFYFTPEMSKAIVQTVNYMDAIVRERFQRTEDIENITQFTDRENLYHPRGIIILSSTTQLTTKRNKDEELLRDFTKLRNNLNNIEILTFDEILNIADEYIKNIVDEETLG